MYNNTNAAATGIMQYVGNVSVKCNGQIPLGGTDKVHWVRTGLRQFRGLCLVGSGRVCVRVVEFGTRCFIHTYQFAVYVGEPITRFIPSTVACGWCADQLFVGCTYDINSALYALCYAINTPDNVWNAVSWKCTFISYRPSFCYNTTCYV